MKKSAISLFVLVVGLLASVMLWPKQTTKVVAAENKALLLSAADLAKVKVETFDNSVPFNGTLKPWQQALLNAQVNAEVRTVHVKAGQAVQVGEVLVQLDTKEIDLRYQQALSAWQSRKLELEQTQQRLNQVKQLHQQKFASRSDLDSAQRQRDIAAAQVDSAKAAVEQIQQQQKNATVVAPFAGRIAERFIDEGQLVSAGTPLIKIIEVDRLELEALVPTNEVFTIAIDQVVKFTVSGDTHIYTGVVQRINPQARSENRRVPIYIDVDNARGRLLAGMFVQGKIKNSKETLGLAVPISAVQETAQGWQVVMLDNNQLTPVSVDLLAKDLAQDKALVRSTGDGILLVDSQVLVAPNQHAQSGRLVQISQVN